MLIVLLVGVFVMDLINVDGRNAFEINGRYKRQPSAMINATSTLGKAARRPPVAIFISSSHCRLL